MMFEPWIALELMLLALSLAAAVVVRPWRLLSGGRSDRDLTTPLLAALVVLPWLWSWPGQNAMALPLQWSGAALAVLMLGWPLAVPVLVLAGMSTMMTIDASWSEALATILWAGLVPATVVLALGHGVRKTFGANPVSYLAGRAFAVPLIAIFGCTLVAAVAGWGLWSADGATMVVSALLLSMGEATWTCAVATVLVACRPQWLATWSEALYLKKQRRDGRNG